MAIYLLDCNHLSAAIRKVSALRDRIHQERKTGNRFVACFTARGLARVGSRDYHQMRSRQTELNMLHVVKIEDREKLGEALEILNFVPGTWHSRLGYMLLPEAHHQALVKAGLIPPNGNGQKANGKKARTKKAKP
jgi:hypothetical protein